MRCFMGKIIKYFFTIALSAAAVFFIVKFVSGTYAQGIDDYEGSISSDVEAKRAELLQNGIFREVAALIMKHN